MGLVNRISANCENLDDVGFSHRTLTYEIPNLMSQSIFGTKYALFISV